jgi:hypothetical protein
LSQKQHKENLLCIYKEYGKTKNVLSHMYRKLQQIHPTSDKMHVLRIRSMPNLLPNIYHQ